MDKALGGKQREPMERLIRLAATLQRAGARGVPTNNLIDVAGFDGEGDPTSQLGREFRLLRAQGWQIDNIGGDGAAGIYRMVTVDNRLRVKLTTGQLAALRRAVLLANREDLVERLGLPDGDPVPEVLAGVDGSGDPALSEVSRALQLGCLLRFRYAGSDRIVHPEAIRTQNGTWYLLGHEDGDDVVKWFVVSRMSEVSVDVAGSAQRNGVPRHDGMNPMTWQVDPPVEVTLRAPAEFAPDVRRRLGEPASESAGGETVDLVYVVTNREALRSRIYELGPRVSVLGPEEIRAEIIDELAFMAGE